MYLQIATVHQTCSKFISIFIIIGYKHFEARVNLLHQLQSISNLGVFEKDTLFTPRYELMMIAHHNGNTRWGI
jgi:hypothetical protein